MTHYSLDPVLSGYSLGEYTRAPDNYGEALVVCYDCQGSRMMIGYSLRFKATNGQYLHNEDKACAMRIRDRSSNMGRKPPEPCRHAQS